jgi:large subunit ribosomal protein L9
MKVILLKDVTGLGRKDEIKEVSDGHARNFLIPRHLVMPATSQMLRTIQKEESEAQAKISKAVAKARELKKKLDNKTFTIEVKASKQSLFAAVHEKQIIEAITKKNHFDIQPKQVIIKKTIKQTGEFPVEINLGESIHAQIKIQVKAI